MSLNAILYVAIALSAPLNDSTDRGVFVYGGLLLDFMRGIERGARFHSLKNCSTEEFYCVDGNYFNVVIPRSCADFKPEIGMTWRLGKLETTLIGKANDSNVPNYHRMPTGPLYGTYYLVTNEQPDVVLAYSPRRGVTTLFRDVRREDAIDFLALARSGELAAFAREAWNNPLRGRLILNLATMDTLAECKS